MMKVKDTNFLLPSKSNGGNVKSSILPSVR